MADKSERFQVIRGCPFRNSIWFQRKNIEDTLDYVPKNGDVVIASYPKTGTTWLQYIVLQITSKATLFPEFDNVTYKVVPFIEMTGIAAIEALTEPRFYKHHCPYDLVQKNPRSKYLYVYRHPEDTVVSLFPFIKTLFPEWDFNFDETFDDFVTGNTSYGSYFRHVLSFYDHIEDPNLLMISYEKLHANRREEILRIAKFLGEEHHKYLQENDAILNEVIKHTSFEYMKGNLTMSHPDKRQSKGKVNFFRKGIVGDGKNVLTELQRQRVKAAAEDVLKGTRIFEEWYQ